MDLPSTLWQNWAESLRKKGLAAWAAWWLEAAGPLNLIGAQFLYLGAPFFPENKQFDALARLLEDDTEARAFAAYLRGIS